MLDLKWIVFIIFLITYLFIIFFYTKKSIIVWLAVGIVLLFGILKPSQVIGIVDWNVILLYFGMLVVSEVFLFSKMPNYLADIFASKAKSAGIAMLIICVFTGALSIFLENVAIVLLVAPVAFSISEKMKVNPIMLFIGMALSSNLQGAATLIGDPPSMLLAGFAKLSFNDFFFVNGKPSIFFAVQMGAIVSLVILYFFFRKHKQPLPKIEREKYLSIIPTVLVVLLILSLICASFFDFKIKCVNGIITVVFGFFSFVWFIFNKREKEVKHFVKELDWQTGLFLIGIFILVGSLSASGILEDAAKLILKIGGGNTFLIFMIIVWMSVLLSAFVDNVPFLVAMLPVTQVITENLGASKYLFFFGLLIGASVGGNITPIGASANIVAVGLLKKKGYNVKFMDFVKVGLPFTIAAVAASSLFLWVIFG